MVFLDWNRVASVNDLTSLRSRRTPTVMRGKRGATYAASLAQAEELWRAAGAVSPLASPILRYYALMQVSLAVDAASPLGNQDWMPGDSHGLTLTLDRPTGNQRLEFSSVRISPSSDGAVQALAHALGSPMIEPGTPLDEVLAALWSSRYLGDDFTAMSLYPRRPLPAHVLLGLPGAQATFTGNLLKAEPDLWRSPARIDDFLAGYPGLRDLGARRENWDMEREERSLLLIFDEDTPQAMPSWWSTVADVVGLDRDPWPSANTVNAMFLPAIGGSTQTIHPLVTWYVALYSLSILARYYGNLWRRRLDIDVDQDAVALIDLVDRRSTDAMDLAATAIRDFLDQARAEAPLERE